MVYLGAFAAAEGVLALCLQIKQFAGAVLAWGVFVCHTRLHHLLQAFTLAGQVLNRIVLLLKRVLQILHHTLLYLFQVLDSHLVRLLQTLMLCCLLVVCLRH